jgi:hypothetical protein
MATSRFAHDLGKRTAVQLVQFKIRQPGKKIGRPATGALNWGLISHNRPVQVIFVGMLDLDGGDFADS